MKTIYIIAIETKKRKDLSQKLNNFVLREIKVGNVIINKYKLLDKKI